MRNGGWYVCVETYDCYYHPAEGGIYLSCNHIENYKYNTRKAAVKALRKALKEINWEEEEMALEGRKLIIGFLMIIIHSVAVQNLLEMDGKYSCQELRSTDIKKNIVRKENIK